MKTETTDEIKCKECGHFEYDIDEDYFAWCGKFPGKFGGRLIGRFGSLSQVEAPEWCPKQIRENQ
jgi:hypothetical protein